MWLSRTRYDELIRAEERAEMLRIRVNELTYELADERHQVTGRPQRVAQLANPRRTARPQPELTPEQQTIAQIEQGLEMFEDIGDTEAQKLGILTSDDGRFAVPA